MEHGDAAQAVVEHLVSRRLPPERLTAAGYGEANAIQDNGTATGREAS